ncbi:hypothetical protein [Xanthocytophaga agilis]|uniref:Uncharacterized protein n=1 Tax=Xanthocytophaga agilis TaxID=3048010 RepID=A0AAE3UGS3_9BACT|nr:hypothetical protein [Xanthocytophaga agilis]MDJ1505273.1 hypothetical protein [Xanthocytophaga agilis]
MHTTLKKTFWWIGVSIGALILFIGWVFVCAFLLTLVHGPYYQTLYDILLSGYTYEQFGGFFCSDGYLTARDILLFLLSPVIFPFLLFFSYKTSPYTGWKVCVLYGVLLVIGFLMGLTVRTKYLISLSVYHNFVSIFKENICSILKGIVFLSIRFKKSYSP